MAVPLSITLNITGEALAKEYRYTPSMSILSNEQSGEGKRENKDDGNDNDKRKASSVPTQLFVPYALRISRQDLIKAGEFVDPKKVTAGDLVRLLGSKESVIRAIDYAQARTGTGGNADMTVTASASSGVLLGNVETIMEILFKNGSNLKLSGEVYTVYSNKMETWRLVPRTRREGERVTSLMAISVAKGKSIGFVKRQKLACPRRRNALRESIKQLTGKDLMGEPVKKPLKTVPRRLVSPATSRSYSSSSRDRRRSGLSEADARRLRRLLDRRDSRSSYSRTPSSAYSSRSRRSGGGKTRRKRAKKPGKTKKASKNHYVLRTWYI